MDITKVSADILDGPNWGTWAVQIQAVARVLNCWSMIIGERIPGSTPPTLWPTRQTSARHSCRTNLWCGAACQVTIQMEQDELNSLGPNPGKVEPGTVAWLCWCRRCRNVLDPSGNQVRKSRRSKYLPKICWNDQTDIHWLRRSSVPDTEVPVESASVICWLSQNAIGNCM